MEDKNQMSSEGSFVLCISCQRKSSSLYTGIMASVGERYIYPIYLANRLINNQ